MASLYLEGQKQRVDKGFIELVKKKYPNKSFRESTKEIKKILEELFQPKKK